MVLRPSYDFARFSLKMWRMLMHKKYGNSMSSKRKRDDAAHWTPGDAAVTKFRKTTQTQCKRHGKENNDPNHLADERVIASYRSRYSYTQKARLIGIFRETASVFMWLSFSQVLDKFLESNSSIPKGTMLRFLRNEEQILALAARDSPVKIRNSEVSPERLVQYRVGRFEESEKILFDDVILRHQQGHRVSSY